jgi:lipopolysaccharide transport system ATP-binding protein
MSSNEGNSSASLENDVAAQKGTEEIAIRVSNLSKCYQIYESPHDRLKQFVAPRLQKFIGRTPKQYFREFWALSDVSFEVKRGETFGIIGRNGSGKSTLLQLICGTLTQSGGEVEINGRVAALLELGAGFNPEFTGRENVYMNAAILGYGKAQVDAKFQDILDFSDIGEFMEHPVKTYSSGMFVRLAFAVQVCVEPDILIVDEALSVGDIFFQQKCMERMQRLVDAGTTVIFVSHDLGAIARACKQALLLSDGRIVTTGPPSRVIEKYIAMSYGHSLDSRTAENLLQSPNGLRASEDQVALSPVPNGLFRHGNGLMRISGFALTSASNESISQIESGKILKITLGIDCYDQPLIPSVGFQIKDRFGSIASGTNTWMLDHKMDCQRPHSSFQINFEIQLMLGSGDYSLTVAVGSYDAKPEQIFDWIDGLTTFTVLRPRQQRIDGLAYCPVKIAHRQIEPQIPLEKS